MKTLALSMILVGSALLTASPQAAKADEKGSGDPSKSAEPKTITTKSGLKITDLKVGTGDEAKKKKTVSVNYRGTFLDGTLFDQSYGKAPFSFRLGAGEVIKGWDEGVRGMKVGGKRKLVVPPELAYGKDGAGGVIPPNATLVFEVELLGVS